jgi:hypothetical protein
MKLGEMGEPLAYEIALELLEPPADVEGWQAQCRDLTPKLRALATVVLLARADVERFRSNLRTSAEIRRDYLRAAGPGATARTAGREIAAGRYEPLLDALAAGALDVAREIAHLSPRRWMPDCEYEEDFWYAACLHALIEPAVATELPVAASLAQFERCLSGEESPRHAACSALQSRDAAAFTSAMEAFLAEHGRQVRERIEEGELDEVDVVTQRRLSVEGLGLLALAGQCGLPVEREYLYCPSLARSALRAG